MPEENQGTGLPQTDGQPASSTPAPAGAQPGVEMPKPVDQSMDPWADAESIYDMPDDQFNPNDPFGLPNAVAQEDGEQAKVGPEGNDAEQPAEKKASDESDQDESEGDLNLDDASTDTELNENIWSAEGLDSPEKVQERLKKAQGLFTKKSQESKQYLNANIEMANMVAQVARDPSSLVQILQQHGKDLEAQGVQVNWDALKSFGQPSNQNNNQEQPKDEPKAPSMEEQKAQFLQGYNEYLNDAKDEADYQKRIGDMLWHVHQQSENRLIETSNKLLERQKEMVDTSVNPFKQKQEQETRVNMWKSAIATVKTDDSLPGISGALDTEKQGGGPLWEYIQNEPLLETMRVAINKNPEAASKRGITPDKLLRTAYNMWSTPQRIKAAEDKVKKEFEERFKGAGEIPGSVTQTVKSGGQDWNEIQEEIGDPFEGF